MANSYGGRGNKVLNNARSVTEIPRSSLIGLQEYTIRDLQYKFEVFAPSKVVKEYFVVQWKTFVETTYRD